MLLDLCLSRDNPLKNKGSEKSTLCLTHHWQHAVCREKRREEAYTRCWVQKIRPVTCVLPHGQTWYMFGYNVIKQHFCAFKSFLQTDTNLESATQFSNASRVNKTSLHVKVCIIAPSVVHVKRSLAFNGKLLPGMNAFMRRWSTPTRRYYPGHQRTLEDFQNFGMLHMTKAYDMATCLCPDVHNSGYVGPHWLLLWGTMF
jgi:hypothetical protein